MIFLNVDWLTFCFLSMNCANFENDYGNKKQNKINKYLL